MRILFNPDKKICEEMEKEILKSKQEGMQKALAILYWLIKKQTVDFIIYYILIIFVNAFFIILINVVKTETYFSSI